MCMLCNALLEINSAPQDLYKQWLCKQRNANTTEELHNCREAAMASSKAQYLNDCSGTINQISLRRALVRARAQQIRRRAKRRKEKLTRAMHFCFLSLLSSGTAEVSWKMEGGWVGGGHKSKRLSARVSGRISANMKRGFYFMRLHCNVLIVRSRVKTIS